MAALKILLAEDNDDHAELISEALEGYNRGNKITRVNDGKKLLQHLQNLCDGHELSLIPELLLVDVKMPRLNGLDALKIIKSNNKLRHIPLMVISTSANKKDINKAYQYGANSYITKPIDYDEFVMKMHELNKYWDSTSERPSNENIVDRG